MGRQAMHTQEQVFAVADQMAANGQEVTPTALRTALGGGSLTTIYKHLDAWQTSKKDVPVQAVFEMPEPVKVAFNGAWQVAANEAAKEVLAVREKADLEVKAVSRRLEEAISNIEQLENEANSDANKIEALEREAATAKAAADQAVTQAVSRESALRATVEQMTNQIEAQAAELVRVHADLNETRQAHAAELMRFTGDFTRQLADQGDALRAANEETSRLRAKLDDESDKLALAKAGELENFKKFTTAEADGKGKAQALTKLETEMEALRAQAADASRRLAAASGEAEALRAQVASQLAVIDKLATKADSASDQPVGILTKSNQTQKKDK